jgi:recombination protein RecA
MGNTSEDRQKALETALAQINKQFGAGSVGKLGEKEAVDIETISTGSLAVDLALGVGGLPKGRIVEIYGPESSGKTLLTLHAIAEVQKEGGIAAFVDAEHALDPVWAAKIGVDVENLIVSQPDNGEQALEIIEKLVRSRAIDLVVVDSVAALVPSKEIEGDMGDSHMGLQARLMSQGLRKITGVIHNTNTTVIFINQLRSKIGVMFGSPETTTGGNALKYYASVRLDIRRISQIKEGEDIIGARTRVKVVKNKVAAPFKQAEFDILFKKGSEGFSRESDIRDLGVHAGIIKKSGAWFTYDTTQLGQGGEKTRVFLKENPTVADEIEAKIKAKILGNEVDLDMESSPEDEGSVESVEAGE